MLSFGPLLVHMIYGIYVVINGKLNVGNYGYIKNWFHVLERLSAIALVLFIFSHVGAMYGWFGEELKRCPHHKAYGSTVEQMKSTR